jgi:hypothetical protein
MRGLSRELAIAGHDFFEVVFHYKAGAAPNPANDVIARTSWELYKEARITGVRGKGGEGDTNYGYTAVYGTASGNIAGNGQGAAILFVGKKTDRTLLAVGRLVSTTNIDGTAGLPTTITTNTRSVTFEVSPLKSGINAPGGNVNVVGSGFYTDYSYTGTRDPVNGNVNTSTDTGDGSPNTTNRTTFTYIIDAGPPLNTKTFPMYKLRQGGTTHAHYYFTLDGATTFASYQNGIILAGIYQDGNLVGAGSYGKKQPRYPVADGRFQYASLRLDDSTVIEPVPGYNTVPPGYNPAVTNPPSYFNPSVRVSFDTSDVKLDGSAFAFVFEIPVLPLSAHPASDGGPAAGTWYVRPSYDSFFLDLDDGTGGAGGAVLLGIGNPEDSSDFRIRVVVPPLKWRYNSLSPAGYVNGRYFNVDGLVVWLETESGIVQRKLDEYTELTYELGMKRVRNNTALGSFINPATRGEEISNLLYSIQTVTVRYTMPGSGTTRTAFFYIICDDDEYPGRYTDIPNNHYFAAGSTGDITEINNRIMGFSGPGTFVIVFSGDVDFSELAYHEQRSPSLTIMVAGKANSPAYDPAFNVRVGRNGNGNGISTYATTSAFYFGKWPFNAELVVRYPVSSSTVPLPTPIIFHHSRTYTGGGSAASVTYDFDSYGYTLNAEGLYASIIPGDPPDAPPNPGWPRPFIYLNTTTGKLYNVVVDDSAFIVPRINPNLY